MSILPEPLKRAIRALSDLPSLGPRQATRLVFALLSRGQNSVSNFTEAINSLSQIKICVDCFFPHGETGKLCAICSDSSRAAATLMIVEKETDLLSLEQTGKYKGRYLVLGSFPRSGLLSDKQRLRIEKLKNRLSELPGQQISEIILGFSPNAFGNLSAELIHRELNGLAKRITRLGRGLPSGGEIEFADEETLGSALDGRA